VAQYYVNVHCGNRARINKLVLNSFTEGTKASPALQILARLPIATYWTTNYDTTIETELKNKHKLVDVKRNSASLATNIQSPDAVVYKMHGDVSDISEVILTKDDYETYDQKRLLFKVALQSDLLTKTFLFIGFSFEDPNFANVLTQMRILLEESAPVHYCFLKKITKKDGESLEDFKSHEEKQRLQILELKRYGIETILLTDYVEIPKLLKEIYRAVRTRQIFISGSIADYPANWPQTKVEYFCSLLGEKLVEQNYYVTSGFGFGIGSAVVNGALKAIYDHNLSREHLMLRPFPQPTLSPKKSMRDLWTRYRQEMIEPTGIDIFVFGNKEQEGRVVAAEGVKQEYEIAKKDSSRTLLPLPSTGMVAKKLYDEDKDEIITNFNLSDKEVAKLETCTDPETLVNLVVQLVARRTRIK
jgi:hypothetical protein